MPPKRRSKPKAKPKAKVKRSKRSKRSAAARKGWQTRKKRERATQLARSYAVREGYHDEDGGPDQPTYPWDRGEGFEPPGGWQGDDLAEEVSFMTHEEKIDFFEYLAEQLDTTVHELFEMMGSP